MQERRGALRRASADYHARPRNVGAGQAQGLDRSPSAEIGHQFKPQKAHLWSVAKPIPVVGVDGCSDWN